MKRPTTNIRTRNPLEIARREFLAGSAGLAVALLAGGEAAQAAGDDAVAIGVMGPYTGPASRSGDSFKKGIALAIEHAKRDGDLPLKIDGAQKDVKIVWVDEQSSPEKATKATLSAIEEDHVKMFVGGFSSAVAMAAMDVEAPYKLVHLGHTGEAQTVSEKVNSDPKKYAGWFKGWPAPAVFAGNYGAPLQQLEKEGKWKPANKKAAIVVEDSDFGRGLGEALNKSLTQAGFEPLPYDVVPVDQTEFSPLLTKYRAQQVSLVIMTFTGSVSASNFVKQFAQARTKALLVGHGISWFGEWYQLTGKASDYIVTADSPRVITPEQKAWVEAYKKEFNEEPSLAEAGLMYDYMRAAIVAINETGSFDFDKLRQTILDKPYKGVWQMYRFAKEPNSKAMSYGEVETGDFMEGFFFPMVQLMDGQANIIFPEQYATGKFQTPPWL